MSSRATLRARAVICKRCGAQVGQPCRILTSRKATETHSVRYFDAGVRGQCWFTRETIKLSEGGCRS